MNFKEENFSGYKPKITSSNGALLRVVALVILAESLTPSKLYVPVTRKVGDKNVVFDLGPKSPNSVF